MMLQAAVSAGLTGGLAAYLAPALVAARAGHPRRRAILVLNLALGWTILPWPALLHWASGTFDDRAAEAGAAPREMTGALLPRAAWPRAGS